jgi:hypothetical protein
MVLHNIIVFLFLYHLSRASAANTCISSDSQEEVRSVIRKSAESKQEGKKSRWAVVCLAKPEQVDIISRRNKALASKLLPFAKKHEITFIFFSELQFPSSVEKSFRKSLEEVGAVRFVDTYSRGFQQKERFGYKYMCKFFGLDMYDYLREFEYYMRCDTDCYMKRLDYDVLQWAEDHKLGYGYALRKLEAHGPTRQTLPMWTQKYLSRCNLKPTAVMDRPLSVCFNFYNNWHIGSVAFFNRPDVRHFLEAVNASGHILSDRWGDSTIQAYAVRLFMDIGQLLVVPNVTYVHGSHSVRVTSFSDETSEVPQTLPLFSSPRRPPRDR